MTQREKNKDLLIRQLSLYIETKRIARETRKWNYHNEVAKELYMMSDSYQIDPELPVKKVSRPYEEWKEDKQ